jgi:hypothetical protein
LEHQQFVLTFILFVEELKHLGSKSKQAPEQGTEDAATQ